MNTRTLTLSASLLLLPLVACDGGDGEEMTSAEVREAIEESVSSARVESVTSEPIEVSTDFTLGQAAEDAAAELAAWWQSQVACADIQREGAVVTIDYGELGDECEYNGVTYAGIHEIEIISAERGAVLVQHRWVGFTDGSWTFDATIDVAWTNEESLTRQVTSTAALTLSTGRIIDVEADRTWSRLGSEVGDGLMVDGYRTWSSDQGSWNLDIDSVELRAQDPVPQAGAYTVTNPEGNAISLTFSRVDEDTIAVTWEGQRTTRTWNVSTASGEVSE